MARSTGFWVGSIALWMGGLVTCVGGCTPPADETAQGSGAIESRETERGVRVGTILNGATGPGRYRLSVYAGADDGANAAFFARAAALAYRDGLPPEATESGERPL